MIKNFGTAITLVVLFLSSTIGVVDGAINIIANPGFESGTTSWIFYASGGGTFTTPSPGYEGNKSALLALSNAGTNIQLYQTLVALEANTRYRLSFAAYSNTGHDMTVRLLKHAYPYTPYMPEFTVNLGTTWQTFSNEFTSSGTANDGRLMFWLPQYAAAGDKYYIDDVRLEKLPQGPIQINFCTRISSPGEYVLTQDIINSGVTGCINITSSDVIFDGAGYTVDGNGLTNYGLYARNVNNITIKNLVIQEWNSQAVNIVNSNNNNFSNITVKSGNYDGFYLQNSNNNILKNISALNTGHVGFTFDSSQGNDLNGATLQNNAWEDFDIYVNGVSACNNEVRNVSLTNNYKLHYYNETVHLNDISAGAIYLCNADNSVITNVSVISVNEQNSISNYFVENVTYSNIVTSGLREAMFFKYSANNTITNILMKDGWSGISYSTNTTNTNFKNATIYNMTDRAIRMYAGASNNVINDSKIFNNSVGIYLNMAGKYGPNKIYNSIFNNTQNIEWGISDFFGDGSVYPNYWNTTKQPGTNIIGGSSLGGNFWAYPNGTGFSQTCVDGNSDGICDSAYVLKSNNIDYLPLAYNAAAGMLYVEDDTEDSYSCEGSFQSIYPCSSAVNEIWDGYYAEACAGCTSYVYENYIIPSGTDGANWTFKVQIAPNPSKVEVWYWDYSSSSWDYLYSTVHSFGVFTFTVRIPSDGLTSSPLKIKTKVQNYIEVVDYYEGKVTWIYAPGRVYNMNKGTDYLTIQSAIDDANPGNEIHVDSGTYYENVNISKQLTLRGIGMPVVDAGGSGSAITLAADGIILEGFAATGGSSYEDGNFTEDAGIKVSSNYNTLIGNIALNNGNSIMLFYSSNNTLIGNNASNNSDGIYFFNSNDNTLIGNNANSNRYGGIHLWSSSNNIINNNIVSSNGWGIKLESSSMNNNLNNNIVGSNRAGISLSVGCSGNFNNNTVTSNDVYGISVWAQSGGNFNNNTISSNGGDGIDIGDSGGSYFNDNTISSNGNNGIFDNSYGGGIYNNNIVKSNSRFGIYLNYKAESAKLTNNTLSLNAVAGIYLETCCNSIYNNRIIYNNFFNNTNNLQFSGEMVFNKADWNITKTPGTNIIGGSYIGGNFWAHPDGTGFSQTCTDADGDGICDSAYVIDSNNTDYLPLALPPNPSITVISPDGGENWTRGSTKVIRWNYTGNPGLDVRIELLKNRVLNSVLTSSASMGSGGSGSYTWQIDSNQSTGADYKVRINSTANSTYTDTSNNNFTISSGSDTSRPTVIGTTPTGTNVSVNTQITVAFNESMNQSSAQTAFSTSPATSGNFSWNGNTLIYTTGSSLSYNTTYNVTVGTGAKNLDGNSLTSPYDWQFTTISAATLDERVTALEIRVAALEAALARLTNP